MAALRSPSSSSARSPNSASATGASMPAATCQAPGSPSSITAACRPRRAARHAHARPIGPPPTTATSRSCADATGGGSLPTPVRPGSGSTVGGPLPPSQPGRGLPLVDFQHRAGRRSPVSDRGPDDPRSYARSVSPRERIAGGRLYLVCDARPREFLAAAIRGGVDMIQLRDKALADEELVTAAREFRAAADAGGALFVLNDRPELVAACGADGVHVGQDDGSPPG